MQSSLAEDARVLGLLSLPLRLPMVMAGVDGLLAELDEPKSASREGIDSLESERIEYKGPVFESLFMLKVSSSKSFGGLSSIPHDRGLELDDEYLGPSESIDIAPSSSICVNAGRKSLRPLWTYDEVCLDIGSDVIASNAAVEGGFE